MPPPLIFKMRQNASGQVRLALSNGPTATPSLPVQPPSHGPALCSPSVAQPHANGPLPCNPKTSSIGNNHVPETGTNGDVPYMHPNALPHNCTSPGEAWKSQHLSTTQVSAELLKLGLCVLLNYLLYISICNDLYLHVMLILPCFFVFLQGLQKGPGSHWAGPNGERALSSSDSADCGPHNQVGHSSATPSHPLEPAVNHLSSPSPSSACSPTSSSHTATSGVSLTKESEHTQGNGPTTNHSSPRHTAGSPASNSSDNPQLEKDNHAAVSRLNHVHLAASSAASSPASALSTTSPLPRHNEPSGSLIKPGPATVNGSTGRSCLEDLQSPQKAELSEASHKLVPLIKISHASSTVSIHPTSSDILKACRWVS